MASKDFAEYMAAQAARGKVYDVYRGGVLVGSTEPSRPAAQPGFVRSPAVSLRPDQTTQSYLDYRKRNRTTVTKEGASTIKEVKKISKDGGLCCVCRAVIPAGKTGKMGWQSSYNFATYGEGSTHKNVVFWFHESCCPETDPMTDELALEFFLGNKAPEIKANANAEASAHKKHKAE